MFGLRNLPLTTESMIMRDSVRYLQFAFCLFALVVALSASAQAAGTCGPNGCTPSQSTPRVVVGQRVVNFQRRVTQPIRSFFSSRSLFGIRRITN